MKPIAHVICIIGRESKNLIEFVPNLSIKNLNIMSELVKFTYLFDSEFEPSFIWSDKEVISLAVIDASIYSQLVIGESVDYLKTTGYMPLVISGLNYFGLEIENVGPKLEKEPLHPIVTITCSFDRQALEIYFLGDRG